MKKSQQNFGGDWTAQKLEILRQYLNKYTTALKSTSFETIYLDAFAGTGYMTMKEKSGINELLLPDLADSESQTFLKGSARIALEVEPRFKKYIFIEKDPKQFSELEKIVKEFPEKKNDIQLIPKDANDFLLDFCDKNDWAKKRAVLFLDPFGMQVTWTVIEAIAKTKSIDLWYLFPLDAVIRLLKNDGKIDPIWGEKLNLIFGEDKWKNIFYAEDQTNDLFGHPPRIIKTANFEKIKHYFINRLESVFTGVATKPAMLLNSKNIPLFLLCFACGNETGKPIALRIANHILTRMIHG